MLPALAMSLKKEAEINIMLMILLFLAAAIAVCLVIKLFLRVIRGGTGRSSQTSVPQEKMQTVKETVSPQIKAAVTLPNCVKCIYCGEKQTATGTRFFCTWCKRENDLRNIDIRIL